MNIVSAGFIFLMAPNGVVVSGLVASEGQQLVIVVNPELGLAIQGGPLLAQEIQASDIQTPVVHTGSVESADGLLLKAGPNEFGQSVVSVDADLFSIDAPRVTMRGFSRTSLDGITTDSTWTELYVGQQVGARVGFSGLGIYPFVVRVCGHKGDNGAESVALEFKGCVRRATSGVSFVGEQSKTVLVRDVVEWDADITIEQGALLVKVRGEDGKNITWVAIVEMVSG